MTKFTLSSFVALALFALGLAAPAQAQNTRSFVSGHGLDTNPCTLSAPCRSFAYALTKTNARGEIDTLDTAGYGTLTIDKSINIVNEGGVEAGVATNTAADAITIAAGPSDVVNLRGLTVTGGGVGNNGITLTSAGTLNIQNCVVRGFANNGLNLIASTASTVNVSDTIASNNANVGVYFAPAVASAAYFVRLQALANASGIKVNGQNAPPGAMVKVTATDSVAAGNTSAGFFALGYASPANAALMLVNAQVSNDVNGLIADDATIFMTRSTVYGNSNYGYFTEISGVIMTFGNNYIVDTMNSGTLTPIAKQ